MKKPALYIILFASILCPARAQTDHVTLKTGKDAYGKVKSFTNGVFTFVSGNKEYSLPVAKVDKIVFDTKKESRSAKKKTKTAITSIDQLVNEIPRNSFPRAGKVETLHGGVLTSQSEKFHGRQVALKAYFAKSSSKQGKTRLVCPMTVEKISGVKVFTEISFSVPSSRASKFLGMKSHKYAKKVMNKDGVKTGRVDVESKGTRLKVTGEIKSVEWRYKARNLLLLTISLNNADASKR